MYKQKKLIINLLTGIFILLTCIEVVFYMFSKNNLFGLIYIIFSLIIIFLLVPIAYNYNKYYSLPRISKLIIVIIFGIFSSYILNIVLLKNMNYIDHSKEYIEKVFITKNIIKGIIYICLTIFTVFEFKLERLLKKLNKEEKDNGTIRSKKIKKSTNK